MLELLLRARPKEAAALVELASSLPQASSARPASEFQWEVCGILDKALKDLDGAIRGRGIMSLGDKDMARHLFVCLLTGQQSTTKLSAEQLRMLQEFITNPQGAEAARAAVIAAVEAGILPEVSKDMEEHAGRKLNTGREDAPEVVVRATAKVFDKNGLEWLFTISEGVTGEVYKDFLGVLKYASEDLLASGFAPVGGSPNVPQKQQPAAAKNASRPASPNTPKPATRNPQPNAPAQQGGQNSFAAEFLVANQMNGKVYWSVQGGQFKRHGLRVWPEVLTEAGFDVDSLDPNEAYDMSGYTAVYEAGQDNHKKVVSLRQ